MMQQEKGDRTEYLLVKLRNGYPSMAEFFPLIRGVERQLISDMNQTPSWRVIAALRRHVSDPRYLRAVAKGQDRYSLYGAPMEEITEEERKHALTTLHHLEEGSPGQQDPDAFFAGMRAVLLKQVAGRFGPRVRDETAGALNAPLFPETVEHLAMALIDSASVEDWRSALDSAGSDTPP